MNWWHWLTLYAALSVGCSIGVIVSGLLRMAQDDQSLSPRARRRPHRLPHRHAAKWLGWLLLTAGIAGYVAAALLKAT